MAAVGFDSLLAILALLPWIATASELPNQQTMC